LIDNNFNDNKPEKTALFITPRFAGFLLKPKKSLLIAVAHPPSDKDEPVPEIFGIPSGYSRPRIDT
jgi:hypothetical protein